jgi:hypothetical protein
METWIDYICKENNFEFDGYGIGGNGIWNTVLNFLEYEEDFDVCIFAWSEPSRDYYPVRNISNIQFGLGDSQTDKVETSDINEKYNKYYMDENLCILRAITWLRWFDGFLNDYYSDKKFIHLYCFQQEFNLIKESKFGNINLNDILVKYPQKRDLKFNFYPHTFKHGINIRPTLMEFADLLPHRKVEDGGGLLHMDHPVHKSLANQLNTVLKDDDLRNGNIVEFNLEY